MLSASVRSSLVCLSCRLAIRQRASGQFEARNLLRVSRLGCRNYASDGHRYSKEEFETLILGDSEKKQNSPSLKQNAATKTSSSSTDSRIDRAENHHELEGSAARESVHDIEKPNEPSPERSFSESTDSQDQAPSRTRPRQSRPFRHELLHHKNISVDALGRPVEAIMIKNPNRLKRSKKQIPVIEEDKSTRSSAAELNWEDLLRESKPSKDPTAEALNNIEEMRPLNTKVLPQKEFEKLSSDLVEGFTQAQLSRYITSWHTSQTPEPDAMMGYSWVKRFVPWESTKEYMPTTNKPKTRLANVILQKLWNISIREHVEGHGRAVIWMEPNTYHVLANTSKHILEALRNDFLDPTNNEEIETDSYWAQLTIRSRKSTLSIILARLDEFAQSIVSQEISTEAIRPDMLHHGVLEELSRITETGLVVDGEKQTVTVSWIAGPDRPRPANTNQDVSSLLEGPAGIVCRLLMVASDNNPENYKHQILTPFPKDKSNAQFVPHHREKRSMAWRDKLLKWARYVSATEKSSPSRLEPLKLASRFSLPEPPSTIQSSGHETRLSATFGHILHTNTILPGSGRRMLSPVVPHPAALTSIAPEEQPIQREAAIILKFAPEHTDSQGSSASSDSTIPQVHLRLPIDPDTDLSTFRIPPNSTLNGIIPSHTSDILFPTENVDVRMAEEHVVPMDVKQPSLQKFLAASEFNLLEGRLRTPSQTTLTVPSNLGGENNSQTQQVLYMFTGLEIHQTVETAWKAYTLRYTSIEAGQHGGQRQELSLHPPSSFSSSSSASDPASEPYNEQDFLQAVEDIVTGRLFPWNKGHALMRTPDDSKGEDYSAELLEGGGAAYREEDLAEALPSAVPPKGDGSTKE